MFKILFVILLGIFLQGCATSYQRQGFSGGYDDMKLGQDMYQISFRGNGYTGSDKIQKYFLRRCAELTLLQGYDFFIFVNQEAESSQQDLGTTYEGTVSQKYHGGYDYSGKINQRVITRHSRTGIIKLFKSGTQPSLAMEAREILNGFEGE